MTRAPGYRGRFAPSPTGPLHFGSLLTAVASYLDARHAGGDWSLRIEDLDPPREMAGAGDRIVRTLERHGLYWDGAVTYQSDRHEAYDAALDRLARDGLLFACCCTRRELGPGGCCNRRCHPGPGDATALRLALTRAEPYEDLILGRREPLDPPREVVLRRRDGLHAYALAVVVDDRDQDISHVIRGRDLLEQTFVQRELFACLGATPPAYGHCPVLTDPEGNKLSKQTGATAVDDDRPLDNLRLVLTLLGQDCADLATDSVHDLLACAAQTWNRKMPGSGESLVYAATRPS
ncbi:MAG: tRNA glutamyl-Q(34) synthetase GluQRS [Halieaceae bacterium]|nr:tRNA glutamyl-Q(34) synthetase GluQRS [Halieaceae bacterium]